MVTVNGQPSTGVPFTVAANITGLAPNSAAVGANVVISGSGFGGVQGASSVTFNTVNANIVNWSDTSITATVPAATTGNVVVTVGGQPSNGVNFTVVPAPSITGLTPTSGAVGASVTVGGTNFGSIQGSSTVKFNGTSATVTSWSDTSVGVTVPAGATTGNVVLSASGVASNGSPFTVLPNITGISPSSGAIGASVTISGTSFGASQLSSTVTFNGTAASSITNWSDTSITAVVPSGATTGNVVVTVNSQPSNGFSFTVIPPPSITNLSPTLGPVTTAVTITGTNFGATQGGSTVKFNGVTATPTTWGDTSIGVTVPLGATTGNVVVTVNGAPSNGSPFAVTPKITGVSPSSGPANTQVTINGTTFGSSQGGSTVTFNGTSATPSSWSDTSIVVAVPIGATTGNVVVTVSGQPSNGFGFTVIPPPGITNLSPTHAQTGTPITITGTSFGTTQGTSLVRFNGTLATPTSWTDTSITTPVPSGATNGNVVVTVSAQPSNGVPFTVDVPTVPPTINSFNPTSGASGTTVTVSGANFTGTIDVKFNGVSASSYTVDSDSQITVLVPAGATTGPITITNGAGPTVSSTNFTVSLIKLSTFEGGSLTDPATGVSATVGTVQLETGTPLKGSFSAHSSAGSSYVQDDFSATDDTYVSFYLRVNTQPASNGRLVVLFDGGTSVGNIYLLTTGALSLRNGGSTVGSSTSPLTVGQLYHVALHQKRGTGSNAVLEGYLAVGDAAFGAPFASLSNGAWTTAATQLRLGSTTGNALDVTTDNIEIDSSAPVVPTAPTVTGFNPTSGASGASVVITGTGFTGASAVKFNGASAAFAVNTSTQISATVPSGASTGTISVTTPGGTGTSGGNFTVTIVPPTPTVTGFNPTSGAVGTAVTITGTNFGATQQTSTVNFNGVPATPTVWSDTSITAPVPAGATTGTVSVTTAAGTGTSAASFTVTVATRPSPALIPPAARSALRW